GGGSTFPMAEAHKDDDQHQLDDHEHRGGPPEDVAKQNVRGTSEVGTGGEGRLWKRTAAAQERERGGGQPPSISKHGRGESSSDGQDGVSIGDTSTTSLARPPRERS